MMQRIERLLNLQPGDLGKGSLLFLYILLIIASYVIGKVARNALFLGQFAAVKLPYFMLIIALLTGFVVAGYVRIGGRTSLRNLQIGSLLFFALNAVLFWWLGHYYRMPWLYPVIYIWVGIFGVLAPAQVWTLANYVLTTREAKRLFALVGGGAITGWLLGGFFAKLIQQTLGPLYGTEVLLLCMALFLLACSVIVALIWRQRERHVSTEAGRLGEQTGTPTPGGMESVWHSIKIIGSSRYLQAISAVICLSSVATTVAGWQLDAVAQRVLITEEKLAAFYANFYLFAAVASLLVNLLLTSRLLRRFGIGRVLFVVPAALVFGEAGLLIMGSLLAAVLMKGADQVLRYSVDKSTVELLYLPVAPNVKLQVKSFIDTTIWRLGDGLAAMAILLFVAVLRWSAVQVGWANLVFLACWIGAALIARQQYVVHLRESIQQRRLDAERSTAPVLDRATTDILADNLKSTDPKEILYALELFRMSHQRAVHPAIRELLVHETAEVREKAISMLSEADDKSAVPQVEKLLHDPDSGVRGEALRFLTHHARIDPLRHLQELGDVPDLSIRSGIVAFLAKPGKEQDLSAARLMLEIMVREKGPESRPTRLEAARLLTSLPDAFDEQITELLDDEDHEVVRAAIASVGKLGKRRFALRLLDLLADSQLAPNAVEALVQMGDRILGALRDHLVDSQVPIEIRRQIPLILSGIGNPEAAHVLEARLMGSGRELRFNVIAALNKIRHANKDIRLDEEMIENVLTAEIMGHYCSYQILGTLGGGLNEGDSMRRALSGKINQEVEMIFRLLALLYPQYDLKSAYDGIQSKDPAVHDNAVEFLDNVLKQQLRNMLLPLIDSAVTVSERIGVAKRISRSDIKLTEETVSELLASDDVQLKSCGACAIGTLELKSLEHKLDECLNHSDPFLCETARQAKEKLTEN